MNSLDDLLNSAPVPAGSLVLKDEDAMPHEECHVCHRPRQGYFQGTLGDLRSSGSGGCLLCMLLFNFSTEISGGTQVALSQPFRLRVQKSQPAILEVFTSAVFLGDSIQPSFDPYHFYILSNAPRPKSDSIFESIGSGAHIADHAGSDQCFAFVKACLNRCLTQHDFCRQSSDSTLPSRVIDLGNDNLSIKLIEPTGSKAAYATLSHCWGKDGKRFKTEKDTLSACKKSIKWEALPPTFQDAVTVTRKLGIRYLWIDSICIIQDDVEDWQVESSKMAEIYLKSQITIAAVASPSSDYQFLKPRRTSKSFLAELTHKDVICDSSKTFYAAVRPSNVHNKTGPLSERAWVFQEEQLSIRTLYYAETEITFECRQWVCCECGTSVGNNHQQDPFKAFFRSISNAPVDTILRVPDESSANVDTVLRSKYSNAFIVWQKMVETYSQRNLTYSTDILPAMAGLAKIFSSNLTSNSTYLAGLWRINLIYDLLWRRSSKSRRQSLEVKPNGSIEEYLAPTFSWASLQYPVEYKIYEEDAKTQSRFDTSIIQAVCLPKGLNPLGEVSDGHIELRGPLIKVSLATRFGNSNEYILKYSDSFISLLSDVPLTVGTVQTTSGTDQDTVMQAASNEVDSVKSVDREDVMWQEAGVQAKAHYTNKVVQSSILNQSGLEKYPKLVPLNEKSTKQFRGSAWCLSLLSSSDDTIREVLVLGLSKRVPGAYERLGLIDSTSKQVVQKLNAWFDGASLANIKIV